MLAAVVHAFMFQVELARRIRGEMSDFTCFIVHEGQPIDVDMHMRTCHSLALAAAAISLGGTAAPATTVVDLTGDSDFEVRMCARPDCCA